MAYQIRLIGPVQGLMGLYTGLAAARVSLRRVHELLDEPVEVVEAPEPAVLGAVRGEIVFEGRVVRARTGQRGAGGLPAGGRAG